MKYHSHVKYIIIYISSERPLVDTTLNLSGDVTAACLPVHVVKTEHKDALKG